MPTYLINLPDELNWSQPDDNSWTAVLGPFRLRLEFDVEDSVWIETIIDLDSNDALELDEDRVFREDIEVAKEEIEELALDEIHSRLTDVWSAELIEIESLDDLELEE